jgi:hypothetical protein
MVHVYTLRVYCKKARSKIALLPIDVVLVEAQRCVAHETVDLGAETVTLARTAVKQRANDPLENMFIIKKESLYGGQGSTFSSCQFNMGAEPPATLLPVTLVSLI